MMAADSAIPVSGYGAEFENGLHEPLPISEKVNGTSCGNLEVEALSANLEDAVKLRDHSLGSVKEIMEEPALQPECHSTIIPEVRDSKFFIQLHSLTNSFETAQCNLHICVGTWS